LYLPRTRSDSAFPARSIAAQYRCDASNLRSLSKQIIVGFPRSEQMAVTDPSMVKGSQFPPRIAGLQQFCHGSSECLMARTIGSSDGGVTNPACRESAEM
jgi:hypothetical protein